MTHDLRDDPRNTNKFYVTPGDMLVLWHFHEGLLMGERYVVTLRREKVRWVVSQVERPSRFQENVIGMKFRLEPNESLSKNGPRGALSELHGLWLGERVVLT